jgi:hypothetical protein
MIMTSALDWRAEFADLDALPPDARVLSRRITCRDCILALARLSNA